MFTKKTIFVFLLLLQVLSVHAALTKTDYLTLDRTDCGITSCTTYYTAKNPTILTITVNPAQFLNVSSVITYAGTVKNFKVEVLVGKQWTPLTSVTKIILAPADSVRFRVIGTFTPVQKGKNGASYSIDHVPTFFGFTYPEYDLWNQTWNKCFNANATYNMRGVGTVNETVPVRLYLNSTTTNLSAIRSDWGDLRIANGTCANVYNDLSHNFVYKNANEAEVIVFQNAKEIRNNTPVQFAVYYNNSAATHVEQSRSAVLFGNNQVTNVRIFTNDNVNDSTTLSYTLFNDTDSTTLSTFGTTTLRNYSGSFGTSKELGTNSVLYTPFGSDTGLDQMRGFGVTLRFRTYNATQTGRQYLFQIGNSTDYTQTKAMEAYLETATTGGSSAPFTIYSINDDGFGEGSWSGSGDTHISTNWTSPNYATTIVQVNGSMARLNSGVTKTVGVKLMYANASGSSNGTLICTSTNNISSSSLVDQPGHTAISFNFNAGDCAIPPSTNIAQVYYVVSGGAADDLYLSFGNNPNTKFSYSPDGTPGSWTQYGGAITDWTYTLVAANATAASSTTNLVTKAYYNTGTVTTTSSLGVPQNNVSYDISFVATKTNVSQTRTTVTFNGTTLYDTYAVFSGSGYPFRTNVSCADGPATCLKYITFGGNAGLSSTGDVISANESLNGTIDEVFVGDTVLGNDQKLTPSMLYAFESAPGYAFSPVLISNLYVPNVSLSLSPTGITFIDDANASAIYTDEDFMTSANVTFEWRVNGSLVNTTTVNVTSNGATVSALLGRGNYSKGATLNVTAWGYDGYYYSINRSVQVTVGGVRPNPVTSLACGAINKTGINCNWTLPTGQFDNTTALLNGSIVTVLSNTTTNYNYTGLSPGTWYNLTFYTTSSDGTQGNGTSNQTRTIVNLAPNITSYTPTNLTLTLAENTTQNFTVNATDDDGNPIVAWFKDNVLQTIANFFTWTIGLNEQGTHNITAIANDTYGASARVSWNVTVTDDFPAPNAPVYDPDGGRFRTYIPLKCTSTNTYSAVSEYEIQLKVNNGSWENVSMGNKLGFLQFDITQYPYYTNFTFNCTASGESGNASTLSKTFTRDYINEFYATTTQSSFDFTSMTQYTFGLYYDAQNPNKNIIVKYAYADCNGDGLFDYVYNYTGVNPSRVKQRFICVFPRGQDTFEIGVFLQKATNDSWSGTGCSNDYDYSTTCLVKKQYKLEVT